MTDYDAGDGGTWIDDDDPDPDFDLEASAIVARVRDGEIEKGDRVRVTYEAQSTGTTQEREGDVVRTTFRPPGKHYRTEPARAAVRVAVEGYTYDTVIVREDVGVNGPRRVRASASKDGVHRTGLGSVDALEVIG